LNLHEAASVENLEEVRRCLDAGTPVDDEDEEGQSALQVAVRERYIEVARLLLDNGADPTRAAAARSGRSALGVDKRG
jgi:ankyrin repeat protein